MIIIIIIYWKGGEMGIWILDISIRNTRKCQSSYKALYGSQTKYNALHLIFIEKENIICISLVNTIMCLNLIEEPNVLYLRNSA